MMHSDAEASQGGGPVPAPQIDLTELGRSLKARWRWIAVPTALAFLASVIFVNIVSPRYTGEAKVLLQSAEAFYLRTGPERNDSQVFDEQAVASQVQVVMSRDLARAAIRQLGLVGNPEFDPLVSGMGLLRRLGVMLGLAKNPFDRAPEDRVLDRYYEQLLVYPVGKSRIVAIVFRSRDPELAARAANAIAELYLNLQEDAKKDSVRSASTWLGTNIETLRSRVAQSEAKVEEFRASTGLLSGPNNTTFITQTLSDLNNQLAQARSSQTDAQARAKLMRDMMRAGRLAEIPDVANNELVRRLFEQRINMRAQLALELRTLLPGHPRIKELSAQLADLDSQIRTATERAVRTLENDARISGSRVESIEAAIEAQKRLVAQSNENEVQLRALEREARTQREQLESYLGRYREATARNSDNALPPDARIVSRAVAPETPSFPKKMPIVALSTLAALLVSAGVVAALELLGGRAPAPVGTPILAPPLPHAQPRGQWPTVEAANAADPPEPPDMRPAFADLVPASALSAQEDGRYDFGALVRRLSTHPSGELAHRILITGVESAADAAAVARGLGRHLAREAQALLIDLDPMPDMGGAPVLGLTDLVAGDASFMDVIERETGSRLHRVGLGTGDPSLLEEESEAVSLAFSAFGQTYDWVLCLMRDGGSLGGIATLVAATDVVILASNHEPAAYDLVQAYERAKDAGAPEVIVARELGFAPSLAA
jgi:succinoglycan biosynthesis transport protein ExoP